MKIFNLTELDCIDVKSIFKNDVVVIPTETVYGLAARIDNEEALKNIYKIKGRPSDNPLIVHISSISMLKTIIDGEISREYQILIDRYWPGPLTLLFKCKSNISKVITGNSEFIAIRMPRNPDLLKLINRIECPLAAPSANTSGKPSPTCLSHVIHDLGENVKYYIDDGPCDVGLESTIFGIINNEFVILRPGDVTKEQIEESFNRKVIIKNKVTKDETTICPGQKYKHYSPNSPVYLFKGDDWQNAMKRTFELHKGETIGILKRTGLEYPGSFYKEFELGKTLVEFSRNIFAGLRALDEDCDVIFVVEVEKSMEGLGIMDRLEKAASYQIF